jgi:hypothetical protein
MILVENGPVLPDLGRHRSATLTIVVLGLLWSLFLKDRNLPWFPVSHFLILNEA